MEERGALLKGIARVLNAGGSALLNLYDAATSIKISALTGEKEKLKGNIRAYEKKIERLYYEIGKEVSIQDDTTRISAAGEAGVKLVAEYRVEIEVTKKRIEEIEAAERLERQRLLEEREAANRIKRQEAEKQVKVASEKAAPRREAEEKGYTARTEPVIVAEPSWPEVPFTSEVPDTSPSPSSPPLKGGEILQPSPLEGEGEGDGAVLMNSLVITEAGKIAEHDVQKETAEPEVPFTSEVPAGVETEDTKEPVAEAAETPEYELQKETAESEAPVAGEELPGTETEEAKEPVAEPPETEKEEPHEYTAEELVNMLKSDLLALCTEKGIEADRRMTKAQIIELILAH